MGNSDAFHWRNDGIYLPRARKPLAQLKKHQKHPGLWVIQYDDGDESIPLNRTRAVEAAQQYAEMRVAFLE